MSVDNSSEPWQKKLADIASAVSGGGGGDTTNDVYVWNVTQASPANEVIPTGAKYWSGIVDEEDYMVYSNLEIENITCTFSDVTIYGVKIKDAPLGCNIVLNFDAFYSFSLFSVGYNLSSDFDSQQTTFVDRYQIDDGVYAFPNLKPITYEGTENFYTMLVYEINSMG